MNAVAAVIGGVSWDLVVDLDRLPSARSQTVFACGSREGIGSTGAGKALNLAALGVRTRLHALIGDDYYGHRARAVLAAAGVEFVAHIDPAGTERHVNLMTPAGERLSIFTSPGTYEPDVELADLEAVVAGAQLTIINISNYARGILPSLRARQVPIWSDVHDWDGQTDHHRDFVQAASHLFISDEQLDDPISFAATLLPGKSIVVVTQGARGATALLPGQEPLHVRAVPGVSLVDCNGAGDAFFAGVAYGHLMGWDWPTSLRAGAQAAAGCVASPGLNDPQLSATTLDALIGASSVTQRLVGE